METFQKRIDPHPGLSHVFFALTYSMAGLKVLFAETAARLEAAWIVLSLALFAAVGAPTLAFMVLILLSALLLCVEALNTALEIVVDRLSPERSHFAKMTKDLGSAAVFFMLICHGAFVAYVTARMLGLIAT